MSKAKISAHIRATAAQRAGWLCEYCKSQERFAPQPFTLDHITPESKGGQSELDNLAYACQGCNNAKSDRMGLAEPGNKVFAPFFHPRTQDWREHFVWDQQFTHILGITATGRATVAGLKMNRKILVSLRAFLQKLGEHPPEM